MRKLESVTYVLVRASILLPMQMFAKEVNTGQIKKQPQTLVSCIWRYSIDRKNAPHLNPTPPLPIQWDHPRQHVTSNQGKKMMLKRFECAGACMGIKRRGQAAAQQGPEWEARRRGQSVLGVLNKARM